MANQSKAGSISAIMEATYHVTKPRQLRLKTSSHSPFPCKVKCPGNDFSDGRIFVRSCWAPGVRKKMFSFFLLFLRVCILNGVSKPIQIDVLKYLSTHLLRDLPSELLGPGSGEFFFERDLFHLSNQFPS